MAKQVINIGTTANDGTGDPIRDAFDKVNDNFTELYTDDAGDVGSIVAGTGISVNAATGDVTVTNSSPNATHTGDVTGSAALTIATDAVVTAKILNDNVTHDKLEARYTAKATSTGTGSQNLDASTATTFLLTGNVATATLTIQNMKLGQVIDIQMTGTLSSAAITLATNFSSTTINKIGTTDFDTAEKNLIQVVCVDDTDAAAIINYSVGKITADTTP